MDVAEALPGPGRANGEGVEGVLVAHVEDRALLEDPAADVQGQRLEHGHVEIRLRQVLEPLLRPPEIRARSLREHETDVEIRPGGGVSTRAAPEEEHRQHVGIVLGASDEAGAIERLGLGPRLVAGSRENLKVTFPEDLAIAEAILGQQ